MSDVVTHLWTSTLVLLVAVAAARFLPLTARTRHALLFCGLAKFAIPPLSVFGIEMPSFGQQEAAAISMQWAAAPVALQALQPAPSSDWPVVLLLTWTGGAALLAILWAIERGRLVMTALKGVKEASARERDALHRVRRQMNLRASVDVVRSPICEAPAVIRIIRPVIVLPDGGCDRLEDAELESLLRHECAHVARRDNLAGLFESLVVSAFWFHPLVWYAQRSLATAREEACDERAAAPPSSIGTYISALSKICRAVLAPRLSGVSCMASAHLKERLSHLMRYESLRNRAWSHRSVVALAIVAVFATAVVTGVNATPPSRDDRYKLTFAVRPAEQPDRLTFSGRVSEVATGTQLFAPNVTFVRGSNAEMRSAVSGTNNDWEVVVNVRDLGSTVEAVLRVLQKGVEVQRSTYSVTPDAPSPKGARRRYAGQPMTLQLKNADIKDVLRTFEDLTGLDIQHSPTLEGSVTIDVRDMPWDEVFETILRQNSLTYELQGKTLIVK